MARYDRSSPTPSITGRLPRPESSRPLLPFTPSTIRLQALSVAPTPSPSSPPKEDGGLVAAIAAGADDLALRRARTLRDSRILLQNAARSRMASELARVHRGWNHDPNVTPPVRRRSQSPARVQSVRVSGTVQLPAISRRLATAS